MWVVDVGDAVAVAVFAQGFPSGVNEMGDALGGCGGFCVCLPSGFLLNLGGDERGSDLWAQAAGALDVRDVFRGHSTFVECNTGVCGR